MILSKDTDRKDKSNKSDKDEKEKKLKDDKKEKTKDDDDLMVCKFGDLTLKIGDSIKPDNKCDECKCITPPMLHCVKNPDC